MAQLKKDQTPLTLQQLEELTEASRYISCPSCVNSKRFWSKKYNCPIWKCRFGITGCPRIGNRCDKFETPEGTK